MFDPLLTLIAAKTKAVGLIAGTAMVTTALVGGGAVAMTAVSDSEDLAAEPAVEQVVEQAAADLEAVVSDTPTVGIEDPEEPGKVRPPLPEDFTCDDSLNHGQNVSAYARSLEKGPGRGEKVSAVAQSDCGKKAETEVEATGVEEPAEEPKEPKAAKPAKPAKADKPAKPEKAAKPARAGKPAKG